MPYVVRTGRKPPRHRPAPWQLHLATRQARSDLARMLLRDADQLTACAVLLLAVLPRR